MVEVAIVLAAALLAKPAAAIFVAIADADADAALGMAA